MKSKGNAPTAAQKRWREAVRELGSVISGGPAVIHHPVGCSGKHNKIEIGHWWVIPLTDEEHKALHRGEEIWRNTKLFGHCESRKEFEKAAFQVSFDRCFDNCVEDLPSAPAVTAILDYHR